MVPRSGSTTISAGEDQRQRAERLEELAERSRRLPPGEVRRGEEAERELRELGRLEARRADDEPAARAVDRRAEDEHGGAQHERGEDERRRDVAEAVVVEPRREHHEDDADERVHRLALEVAHRVAVPERGGRRRGAVDHDEAERDETERQERDQPLVRVAVPGSSPQRLHELAERVASRLEVAELVEARARRREQDDVAGCGGRGGPRERRREVAGADELDARGGECGRDLVGRLADEVCAVARA